MSRWKEISNQAERNLIELLSEESKNVEHSIETDLESHLHVNFPADLVTGRNCINFFKKLVKKPNKY